MVDNFQCTSCKYPIDSQEGRDIHYKSKWHRYNIRRSVAGLKALSETEFEDFLLDFSTSKKKLYECAVCNRTFDKENGYKGHLHTKKHKKKVELQKEQDKLDENLEGKIKIEGDSIEVKEEKDEVYVENECLMCRKKCKDLNDLDHHQSHKHSFFILKKDLKDLPGLMNYIVDLLFGFKCCLFCFKQFKTVHAVRKHMEDKSHFKIDMTDELEVFYNEEKASAIEDINELGEVVLANGTILGNRENLRYYKQRPIVNTVVQQNIQYQIDAHNSTALTTTSKNHKALTIQSNNFKTIKKNKNRKQQFQNQNIKMLIRQNKNVAYFRDKTGFKIAK